MTCPGWYNQQVEELGFELHPSYSKNHVVTLHLLSPLHPKCSSSMGLWVTVGHPHSSEHCSAPHSLRSCSMALGVVSHMSFGSGPHQSPVPCFTSLCVNVPGCLQEHIEHLSLGTGSAALEKLGEPRGRPQTDLPRGDRGLKRWERVLLPFIAISGSRCYSPTLPALQTSILGPNFMARTVEPGQSPVHSALKSQALTITLSWKKLDKKKLKESPRGI